MYTLGLRVRWFPSVEFAFFAPVAVTLAWGGWLISQDLATIGVVTTVALYVQQMAGPLDELISWLDELSSVVPPSKRSRSFVPMAVRESATMPTLANVVHGPLW